MTALTLPPLAPTDTTRMVDMPRHPFPAMVLPSPKRYDGTPLARTVLADLLLLSAAITQDTAAMTYGGAPVPPEPARLALIKLLHAVSDLMRGHGREARDFNASSRLVDVSEVVVHLRTLATHSEALGPAVRYWLPRGLERLHTMGWPVPLLPPLPEAADPWLPLATLDTWAPAPADHPAWPQTAAQLARHYHGDLMAKRLLAGIGCAQIGFGYDVLYGALWESTVRIRRPEDLFARIRLTTLTAHLARFHAGGRTTAAERRAAATWRLTLATRYVQWLNAYESPYLFASNERVMMGVIEARHALAKVWWPVARRVTHRPAEDTALQTDLHAVGAADRQATT